jgi:hypothetical protein
MTISGRPVTLSARQDRARQEASTARRAKPSRARPGVSAAPERSSPEHAGVSPPRHRVLGPASFLGRPVRRFHCQRDDGSYESGKHQRGTHQSGKPNHDCLPWSSAGRPRRAPPGTRGEGRPLEAGDPTSGRARPRVRCAPWRRITGRAALDPSGSSSVARAAQRTTGLDTSATGEDPASSPTPSTTATRRGPGKQPHAEHHRDPHTTRQALYRVRNSTIRAMDSSARSTRFP